MPRSSSCSIRRCAASRSPLAAVSCSPHPTKPGLSACAAACRDGGRANSVPQLIFVGGHFSDYQRLGDAAIKVLDDFTPLVERISIDEAFADVAGCTHLFGPPAEIAATVRRRVRAELGLPISIGVARTKHLAKIASQVAKPDGLVVVDPDSELAFLHDLPVGLMWGVGPATKARLAEIGVETIGQLAKTHGGALQRLLGPAAGEKLAALAWNRDPRKLVTHRRAHSAGAQSALGKKPAEAADLRPDAAASGRQGRQPAAGEIAAGPHGDGARPLRRFALGDPLGDARPADFGDRHAGRDRPGSGARRACRPTRMRRSFRCWRSRCRISRKVPSCNWNCRSASTTTSAGPAQEKAWRALAPTAPSTRSASASASRPSATASVALDAARSVPDAFRELAEKEL